MMEVLQSGGQPYKWYEQSYEKIPSYKPVSSLENFLLAIFARFFFINATPKNAAAKATATTTTETAMITDLLSVGGCGDGVGVGGSGAAIPNCVETGFDAGDSFPALS